MAEHTCSGNYQGISWLLPDLRFASALLLAHPATLSTLL
jgi:hypothetical protein